MFTSHVKGLVCGWRRSSRRVRRQPWPAVQLGIAADLSDVPSLEEDPLAVLPLLCDVFRGCLA